VEALRMPNPRSPTEGWVTASIGVASIAPAPDNTPRDLLLMADRHLYAAKEAGRNRIVAQPKREPCAVKVMSLT
jgi:diguanylate cyclase (GGDEF)-like protein